LESRMDNSVGVSSEANVLEYFTISEESSSNTSSSDEFPIKISSPENSSSKRANPPENSSSKGPNKNIPDKIEGKQPSSSFPFLKRKEAKVKEKPRTESNPVRHVSFPETQTQTQTEGEKDKPTNLPKKKRIIKKDSERDSGNKKDSEEPSRSGSIGSTQIRF